MREKFRDIRFKPSTEDLIEKINDVVDDYLGQGYRLTVRQLYYQLVKANIIPNSKDSYRKVTSTVNDARLAGLIDWDAIEDRTREFIKRTRWNNGGEILEAVSNSYHMDLWHGQTSRVFVVIEKEALVGVLEKTCHLYDVPLLAARGYPSVSVLYEFARKDLEDASEQGQIPILLHLGDHDPSGIDMTRDLRDRLDIFGSHTDVEIRRIALTMEQIEEQKPPPNPAKDVDPRFDSYREEYGEHSWELDALNPAYLNKLVSRHIAKYIDRKTWQAHEEEISAVRKRLATMATTFDKPARSKKR